MSAEADYESAESAAALAAVAATTGNGTTEALETAEAIAAVQRTKYMDAKKHEEDLVIAVVDSQIAIDKAIQAVEYFQQCVINANRALVLSSTGA